MRHQDAGSQSVLSVDCGQSSIKCRHTLGVRTTEWTLPGVRTAEPLVPQLVAVLEDAAGRGCRASIVGVAASGLDEGSREIRTLLRAAGPLGARRAALCHDSVAAYLGALGDRCGAVVAAGTGVVTLGVGTRAVSRVDGWGYLIGDAGSGYWMGRAALDAVMRAADGRGPATALSDVVGRDFPVLSRAYLELQASPDRVRRIARYADAVGELAETDAVAADIAAAAGAELAVSALAALRGVEQAAVPAPLVAGVGGVFRARHVRDSFVATLRRTASGVVVNIGQASPLDGVAALHTLPASHPLTAHIAVASA